MNMNVLDAFSEVWCVDFEFSSPAGENPQPICCVAHEINTAQTVRLWGDEMDRSAPPYHIGADALMVAFYSSAEIGCHLALNWPIPQHLLDLYAEFRNLTNGLTLPCGVGLLGALMYYGLPCIETLEKDAMRQLALRGGPWTIDERQALSTYCESDVMALARLLPRMLPHIDLPRALMRGRAMIANARIERTGTPIDGPALAELREQWEPIQDRLIAQIDRDYGVFEGRRFIAARWEQWLEHRQMAWPRHPSGRLKLDDDTFRERAKRYPSIRPIQQLRASLAQMRLSDLSVGSDDRNRCLLSAFRAKTGRNQPSTTRFIFGPAVWIRGLIRPQPGYGLAYLDYSQQEFGIAAYLSGDKTMSQAYETGDPYLAFAKQAGAVPQDATKQSHSAIREQFKDCALGMLFGMGPKALALRIGQSEARAKELIRLHREAYPTFWKWSDSAVDYGMLTGRLPSVFGWWIHVGESVTARTLRNFPMQANGAEMLRLAYCFATERGLRVCAPVHDALLIESPSEGITDAVKVGQLVMAESSGVVLGGPMLRSDAKIIKYPDRYQDERGIEMWNTVWKVIDEIHQESAHPSTHPK
jgi:DNA polymerase I